MVEEMWDRRCIGAADMACRAEVAVLGAVLLENAVWPQAAVLSPCDFSLSANRTIFARMCDLQAAGVRIDMVTLIDELNRHGELESVGDAVYISSLIDGVPERSDLRWHVAIVRRQAGKRHIAQIAESISNQALEHGIEISVLRERLIDLEHTASQYESNGTLRGWEDIPDLMEINVPPAEWLVEGTLPRKSLMLWSGTDGIAKTYLAMHLALTVASGGIFLNRQCSESRVLYIDYENPDHEVKTRLRKLGGVSPAVFRTWGTWVQLQPPMIGDPILLKIATEEQPLMIFDPLRFAHTADENDSTAMAKVMRHLRSYVSAGATVIVVHHSGKAEGSTSRGSSAIRGAVDVAYSQEMHKLTGALRLECVKNRFGQKPVFVVRADFENGRFDMVPTPEAAEQRSHDEAPVKAMKELIEASPAMMGTQIVKKLRIGRTKGFKLLAEGVGNLWQRHWCRPRHSWLYYPVSSTDQYRQVPSTAGTDDRLVPAVPTP